jgi:hypothetical protein
MVVPQGHSPLPEGICVDIVISSDNIPEELRAEFVAWERASDKAWALIDAREREQDE